MATAKGENNSVKPEEDDFYDDATVSFPSKADLAPDGTFARGAMGPGRLVAIWALANGTGMKDGKPYRYVDSITLVLDDGPDGNYTSDLVGPAPFRIDKMQHSTGGLVARLSTRVTAKNQQGVPLKYRPMVGRINTQPSRANPDVAAYSISLPTDADRAIANRYKSLIIDINNELEAADAANEDAQAFE